MEALHISLGQAGSLVKTLSLFYENFTSLSRFIQENCKIFLNPNNSAILVQLFSSRCEQSFYKELLHEIRELLPTAVIIGTTSSGVIKDGEVSGVDTVISFSIFQKTNIRTAIYRKDVDEHKLGQTIANDLVTDQTKLLMMFTTSGNINVSHLLHGIQKSLRNALPMAGGVAGNAHLGKSFVFGNSQIEDLGVVCAVLESDELLVKSYAYLGWQPIGKVMTVTKAIDERVYTIDNMPAYEIYRKYLGIDEIGNFYNAIEFPLIIQRNKTYTAKSPVVHYKDDSLGFAAEIKEGENVRFGFGHVGMISDKIKSLTIGIKNQPTESIFIYSCECRRGFLQELSHIEVEPLAEIAATAGCYTGGEIFFDGTESNLLNAMMTMVILSESPEIDVTTCIPKDSMNLDKKLCLPQKDNVAGKSVGVLKALTNLINKVTEELESTNKELKYISLHDSLTGLYNRTFFEQEMKRFETLDCQVGIIICDLDNLKETNDQQGHSLGDKLLKTAAKLLESSAKKGEIVARIGGDEFAILIPNAKDVYLKAKCKNILYKARCYSKSNINLLLSIGYSIKDKVNVTCMEEAFRIADEKMYKDKATRKSNVCSVTLN